MQERHTLPQTSGPLPPPQHMVTSLAWPPFHCNRLSAGVVHTLRLCILHSWQGPVEMLWPNSFIPRVRNSQQLMLHYKTSFAHSWWEQCLKVSNWMAHSTSRQLSLAGIAVALQCRHCASVSNGHPIAVPPLCICVWWASNSSAVALCLCPRLLLNIPMSWFCVLRPHVSTVSNTVTNKSWNICQE